MRSSLARLALLVGLLALLVQGGSLPHQHLAAESGLFNHDHDLSTLATVAGALLPLGPDPTPTWISLAPPATRVPIPHALAPHRHAGPRAPPLESSSAS